VLGAALLTACAGEPGPAGPAGPAGPQGEVGPAGPAGADAQVSCVECHDSTDKITEKQLAWSGSLHGSGTATAYAGGRANCSGCHSGGGFVDMLSQGLTWDKYEVADTEPSRPDCRTCHEIHTTYTGEDWALRTTAAVTLQDGTVFDGGKGNLCATCHQPRTFFAATDGKVEITSTHWGPHHGPQSAILLGVGGAGVESSSMAHAKVENTCVGCHLNSHAFEPSVAVCAECHTDAKNFDINGVQTEVAEKAEILHAQLVAKGLLDAEGTIVVGTYDEALAGALWNYVYVTEEDKSMGVHNPGYINAMLDYAIEASK